MRHTASSMVTHPHLGSTSWLTLRVLTNKQLRILRAAVASIAGVPNGGRGAWHALDHGYPSLRQLRSPPLRLRRNVSCERELHHTFRPMH